MGWTAGEIAGFIGAAAWLPHLARWIYSSVARPHLTLLTGSAAEVGYTSFGPIFNVRLSFSCARRDVVINRLGLQLTHESGDRRVFGWRGTRETFSHLKDASGTSVGSVERDSEAIAVKVTTRAIYESFFRFQELKFIEAKEPLVNAVLEHESYLRANPTGNCHETLLASAPMHKLNSFHRDAFWWQPGTYTIDFQVSALTAVSVARTRHAFSLSTVDVEALRKNIEHIPRGYEVVLKAGTEGFDVKEPTWNWRNPVIRRV